MPDREPLNHLEVEDDGKEEPASLIARDEKGEICHPTKWGTRSLKVEGKDIEAHETNNLFINILHAKEIRDELAVNPTAPMLGRTRDFYFKRNNLQVFSAFEDNYSQLHAKLLAISAHLLSETDPEARKRLYTERDINSSIAWEHLAQIALAFDPHADIDELTV
jgi:hypothetical protein